MTKNFSIPISRRDFLKLAGLTAGAIFSGTTGEKKVSASSAAKNLNFSDVNLPTVCDADICICGGGSAGTAAAVSAARNGLKTVLIERGIVLGGQQTQGLVYPCMPTFAPASDTPYISEVNARMRKNGVEPTDPERTMPTSGGACYQPEILATIYDEICAETGVEIFYNTNLIGAKVEEGKIISAVIQTIEGFAEVRAKIFVDATGDALLSRFSGVPVAKGSEKSGKNQPMSFRFEMGGVDEKKLYRYIVNRLDDEVGRESKLPYFEFVKSETLTPFFEKGVASGELTSEDIVYIQAMTIVGKPGTLSMNCPELPVRFGATDFFSYSRAVSYGRVMMRRLANFFVKNMPGFKKAYISREASILGVRESWRIFGKYYMTAEDYFGKHRFPDAICRTAYQIDIHDEKLDISRKLKKGDYYEIPYRALVTNEIENLIVVGRCISANFAAQASVRIQPTCMSMGEAAGIAAAWSLQKKIPANLVEWDKIPPEKRSYINFAAN